MENQKDGFWSVCKCQLQNPNLIAYQLYRPFNNIINPMMDDELSTSLILKFRKSKSHAADRISSFQSPRRQSVRIKRQSLIQKELQSSNISIASSQLQWQKSDTISQISPTQTQEPNKRKTAKGTGGEWYGAEQRPRVQRSLNDKFFKLQPAAQKAVYMVNYVLNIAMRVMFINLLVFLGISNKWIYLKVFLSLQATAIAIYLIVMVKLLFTRSDRESVYFQKIFNQAQWADIQEQRLMRTHFNLTTIASKVGVFFNPFTKFQKNVKISFLRQELFKRMELVMVYVPFSLVFFINPNDFVTEGRPNFNIYITAAICLEAIRTVSTYLVIYIYN